MSRRFLTPEEALSTIYRYLKPKPVGSETLSVRDAINRILAEDIRSIIDIPPFDKSKVDGYAVRAEDTFGADEESPVELRIIGKIRIGELPKLKLCKGEAAEISTGCAIPNGANAVVMYEYTTRNENRALFYRSVVPYDNVVRKGSDIKSGEIILRKFTKLGVKEIGLIAAIGLAKVRVFKRPDIALFSIGEELTEPGQPLYPAKIYDINASTLYASIVQCECNPHFLGIAKDNRRDIEHLLRRGLEIADAVVTSGSTSIGAEDLLPTILTRMGKPGIIIEGLRSHPGKPTMVAIVGEKPIFSLPGRPTSALIAFHLLVRPILLEMAGATFTKTTSIKARVTTRVFSKKGRRTYVPVKLEKRKGQLFAQPFLLEAEAITTFGRAHGFIEISEDREFLEEGEVVTVWLFSEELPLSE